MAAPARADTGLVVDQSSRYPRSGGHQRSRIQSFRTVPDPEAEAGGATSHRWNGHGQHGDGHGDSDPQRASTGQLVSQAAGQISTLVRTELALGKAELVEKGKRLGVGGAMLATAGLLSLFTLGLAVALFVVVLDLNWPLWLAVLVPLLAIGTLALLLAGLGARKLRAGAPVPTQAAHSVRDDILSLKQAFSDGRHPK
jgi:hypothetical protein